MVGTPPHPHTLVDAEAPPVSAGPKRSVAFPQHVLVSKGILLVRKVVLLFRNEVLLVRKAKKMLVFEENLECV